MGRALWFPIVSKLNSRYYQKSHESEDSRLIITLNITVFGYKICIVAGIPTAGAASCSEARNVCMLTSVPAKR